VAYASNALSRSQRHYCATYRELLAVVKMAHTFRPYLYGQEEVLLRTDHRALLWLQNFKNAEGMLARWLTSLSEYNFKLEYREGDVNMEMRMAAPEFQFDSVNVRIVQIRGIRTTKRMDS